MTTDAPARIADLAQRLKEASPLDSPELAARIAEQIETLKPQLPQIIEATQAAAERVSQVTKQWSKVIDAMREQQQVVQQTAAYVENLGRDRDLLQNLERAADAAQHLHIDHAELARVAQQLHELQKSGALDILAKYQQQLAEMAANMKKLMEGQR